MKYRVNFVYYWEIDVDADSQEEAEYVANTMFCDYREKFENIATLDGAYPTGARVIKPESDEAQS